MRNIRTACVYLIAILIGIGASVSGIQSKPLFYGCIGFAVVLAIAATATLDPVAKRLWRKHSKFETFEWPAPGGQLRYKCPHPNCGHDTYDQAAMREHVRHCQHKPS